MNGGDFKFFVNHSDEKVQQIALLNRKIMGTLLDVGAGEGTITRALQPMFERVEVVEEKKEYCDSLEKCGIICHNCRFEDFETNNRYSVILASHLLTYLADKDKAIEKMYKLLKVGGRLYLFNMDYDGLMQMIKEKIHPEITHRTDVQVQEIVKRYPKYERDLVPIHMETGTADEMVRMVRFLSEKRPEMWKRNEQSIKNLITRAARVGNGFSLGYYNVLYTIYKI